MYIIIIYFTVYENNNTMPEHILSIKEGTNKVNFCVNTFVVHFIMLAYGHTLYLHVVSCFLVLYSQPGHLIPQSRPTNIICVAYTPCFSPCTTTAYYVTRALQSTRQPITVRWSRRTIWIKLGMRTLSLKKSVGLLAHKIFKKNQWFSLQATYFTHSLPLSDGRVPQTSYITPPATISNLRGRQASSKTASKISYITSGRIILPL